MRRLSPVVVVVTLWLAYWISIDCLAAWIQPIAGSTMNQGATRFIPRLYEHLEMLPRLARWDSFWYGLIADFGYHLPARGWDQGVAGFLPLYPWLMRLFGKLMGIFPFTAGIWLSRFCLLGAMLGMVAYLKPALKLNKTTAVGDWVVPLLVLLASPVAFILVSAYTESLFLLEVVLLLLACQRRQYAWAMVAAFLAGLTRIQMLALLPVLLFIIWQARRSKDRFLSALPLVGWLISLITLGLLYWMERGNALAYFQAKQLTWGMSAGTPWGLAQDFMERLATVRSHAHYSSLYIYWEIPVLILLASAVYGLWRAKELVPAVWVGSGLALSLAAGTLWCLPRYALALFPAFLISRKLSLPPWAWAILLTLSFTCQIFLLHDFIIMKQPSP